MRELQLGIIIASFINQDPEWLHKVTKPARVAAAAGTDVSHRSQGVDQSSRLLISHLPLAASHEHKYFVGILSSRSLRARLPFFLLSQPFLITHSRSCLTTSALAVEVTRHPGRERWSMWSSHTFILIWRPFLDFPLFFPCVCARVHMSWRMVRSG